MRHETRRIVQAFMARTPRNEKRTTTDGTSLFLHGNKIAWWEDDRSLRVTMAGWGTVTTRERLNGVMEFFNNTRPFHQKAGEQYMDDREIDPHDVQR